MNDRRNEHPVSEEESNNSVRAEAAAAAMPGAVTHPRGGNPRKVTLWRGMLYREFRALLLDLGFLPLDKPDLNPAYRDPRSGTLVVLPPYGDEDPVSTLDLSGFRKLALERGLVDEVVASGLER